MLLVTQAWKKWPAAAETPYFFKDNSMSLPLHSRTQMHEHCFPMARNSLLKPLLSFSEHPSAGVDKDNNVPSSQYRMLHYSLRSRMAASQSNVARTGICLCYCGRGTIPHLIGRANGVGLSHPPQAVCEGGKKKRLFYKKFSCNWGSLWRWPLALHLMWQQCTKTNSGLPVLEDIRCIN